MNPPPVTNPSPSVHVDQLPPAKGKAKDEKGSSAGNFNFSGRIGTLTGAIVMSTVEQDLMGPTANVEISVEKGKARAYIADGKGYQYIEATPGKPARIRGDLWYAGGWFVWRLEAVDGDAQGVSYRAWRSK
jgi:hypothetical protein